MFPYLVVLIAAYMVLRGYRKAKASGYHHYVWIDGILPALALLVLLLPFQVGTREAQNQYIGLVLSWIGIRALRTYWDRRQEKVDPARWRGWERALLLTASLDRLLLRFPVQQHEAD